MLMDRWKKLVRCVVMEGCEGLDECELLGQVAQVGGKMEVRTVVRGCVPDSD
jgi:hypothetical protein